MIHKFTSSAAALGITWIVPEDCKLLGVKWTLGPSAFGDAGLVRVELSFLPTSSLGLNDVSSVIDMFEWATELTTSGGLLSDCCHVVNLAHLGNPVSLDAGEKVYTNWTSAGFVGTLSWILYTDARIGAAKRNMRRQ